MTKKAKVRAAEASYPCPSCGAAMVHETRPMRIEYKGHVRDFPTLAWWCDACDDGVIVGADGGSSAYDRAYAEFRANVDGVLSPAEVTRIREHLGLSKRAAGELLGGGPRSFQKYESGETAVSQPMSNLLRLLDRDPHRLRELTPEARKTRRAG